MKRKLFDELQWKIQEWVDDNCEDDIWIDAWWPECGAELMATAARMVADALVAERKYIKDYVTEDA